MPKTKWALLGLVMLAAGLFWAWPCRDPLSCPGKSVSCVLGEGEAEGLPEMLILSHALINRGTFRGVNGCNSSRVKGRLYPRHALIEASLAWEEAKRTHKTLDLSRGATNWLSNADLARASWRHKCEYLFSTENHHLYKCP